MEDFDSGKAPPSHKVWTAQDEAALAKLEAKPVSIKETALGRLKEQHKQELLATFRAMPPLFFTVDIFPSHNNQHTPTQDI
mmetsp:Transcript_21662/g.44701  ORF Transcript_21662/g.44701 Transcript_21662/m.44701 type:complete len:81 (+) Transcript_21662:144-386(+)